MGTASEADECMLIDTVKTLVDLRSEQVSVSPDSPARNTQTFSSHGVREGHVNHCTLGNGDVHHCGIEGFLSGEAARICFLLRPCRRTGRSTTET